MNRSCSVQSLHQLKGLRTKVFSAATLARQLLPYLKKAQQKKKTSHLNSANNK